MVAVVVLTGVNVRHGGSTLLQDISLTIEEDERWVVLGPNGAGKTTLLALLSAQMFPTSGRVSLLGEVLGEVDVFELRPRIGLSSSALAMRIGSGERVGDVVVSAAYGAVGRWREEYDTMDFRRAAGLMAQFRVQHLADRRYGTLSEGERKRVELARALMTDPELLLLDEPGAGLDLSGREILVSILSDLAMDPDAPTTVLVTHHPEEIPQGITHALLLNRGRSVAQGPISEVLTDDNLSRAFELPLRIGFDEGRWTARARRPRVAVEG